MTAHQNFTVPNGTSPVLTFVAGSPPQNITGWTIQMFVRAYRGAALLLTLTATILAPLTGVYSFQELRGQILALGPGMYLYEIQRVDGGFEDVLVDGWLIVPSTARDG